MRYGKIDNLRDARCIKKSNFHMFLAGYPQSHAEFVQRTTKVGPASKINRGEINTAKHAIPGCARTPPLLRSPRVRPSQRRMFARP